MGSIEAARLAGTNPAIKAHTRQQNSSQSERHRIVSLDLEELAGNQPSAEQGQWDSNRQAQRHLPEGSPQYHAHHVGAGCSHSHANADFPGALLDRVGGDSVQPDGCQSQGQ